MKLLLYGVSGHTVSLEDRDKYLINQETVTQHLNDLKQFDGVEGIILFANSFRTEYYLNVEETLFRHGDFLRYLSDYSGKDIGDVILETYSKFNADAIRHLLYVTAGMDSEEENVTELMIKAEEALEISHQQGECAGPVLEMLFEKAVSFSSQMQSLPSMAPLETGQIGRVVRTFVSEWESLKKRRFLLAGDDADVIQMAKSLFRMGARHITIANLEKTKSESLTKRLNEWVSRIHAERPKRVFFSADNHNLLYRFSASDGIVISSEDFSSVMTKTLSEQINTIRPNKKKQLMIDLAESVSSDFLENEPSLTVYSPESLFSLNIFSNEEEDQARKLFEETVELEAENVYSWYQSTMERSSVITQTLLLESKKDKTYQ